MSFGNRRIEKRKKKQNRNREDIMAIREVRMIGDEILTKQCKEDSADEDAY